MSTGMIEQSGAPMPEAIERALLEGDLGKLSVEHRLIYYRSVCESLGLNPLTRPFDYVTLQGKTVLYARKDATEQLRVLRQVNITGLTTQKVDDIIITTATGTDRTGRSDIATGSVSVAGLRGEALANAWMKAETKAKRRLTLSLCGLGLTDESEVESIPSHATVAAEIPAISAPAAGNGIPMEKVYEQIADFLAALEGAGSESELVGVWANFLKAQDRFSPPDLVAANKMYRARMDALKGAKK